MHTNEKTVMILGVGNVLFADEGFGIHVAHRIEQTFEFPDNVSVVDGGVLGVNLLGVISKPDHLIVVDIVQNGGVPGTLYRLAGDEIPERIVAKNSLHQVDLLEALTLCRALDHVPETVIIGIEPEDMETLDVNYTPTVAARMDDVVDMVLAELDRLKVGYKRGTAEYVPRHPLEDH
jgi:hydrogenase maturation protease